jgi:DNA-binding NarL/FixJ family response regulator
MYTSHASHAQPFSYHATPATLWPKYLLGQTHAPLRVILIDDDMHAISSIKQEINHDDRINLVATAVNARQAKKLIANSEFDVMLIDTHLSNGDGLGLISLMKQSQPSAEAVVISKQEDEELAVQAFGLGAAGFLVKNAWFGSFSQAVLQVANGGAFISPKVARQLLARLSHSKHPNPAAPHTQVLTTTEDQVEINVMSKKLSHRELEILQFVAVGDSSAHISSKTSISIQTVSTHIKNAYRKLNVHTRLQAVASARGLGLIL